jgi:hypothetical protein
VFESPLTSSLNRSPVGQGIGKGDTELETISWVVAKSGSPAVMKGIKAFRLLARIS